MLQYSKANAKLKKLYKVEALTEWLKFGRWDRKANVYSLDLLSGWSCPFAKDCKSKVHETGNLTKSGNLETKLKDGIHTLFRCFSASQEAQYTDTFNLRKHNFDALRYADNMDLLLMNSLPEDAGIVRIHVAGDFFNADYMRAWYNVASMNPSILFR